MKITFTKATSPELLQKFYPVMKELRSGLSYEDYLSLHSEARRQNDYEIVAAMEGEEVRGVMGYRILHDFVHGKHLYVDDLVSAENYRSRGIGALLLKHAEEVARLEGCRGLRLCTGVENEAGKRFYEREGWIARALAFKKKL